MSQRASLVAPRPAPREVSVPPPSVQWAELDLETAVTLFAADWQRLGRRAGAPPTGDPAWQRPYWRAFGGARPPSVHVLHVGDGVGAVLVVRRDGRLLPRWTSGVNAHTPYCAVALDRSPHAALAAVDRLMASARLADLGPLYVRAPETVALTRAARVRGFRVARDAAGADAVLDLPSSWAAVEASLSDKLLANTRRALRRLEREGEVAFDVVTGGPELARNLDECFTLETLGWKSGPGGAPIRSRPDTLQFYSRLAEEQAAGGTLALYTLRLNGTLIAFEYCLRRQSRIDLLKISYHPDFKQSSPGNVLRFLLLQREIEAGHARAYHMGLMSEWKARWASRVEPLCRLRIYDPGPRGTAAYLLRSWLPACARRHPLLRTAWRRLRS